MWREIAQRTHIMQAVSKFNEHDSNILCGREHDFSDILRSVVNGTREFYLLNFGQTFDKLGNFFTEFFTHFLKRSECVLDDIMQKRRTQCRCIRL